MPVLPWMVEIANFDHPCRSALIRSQIGIEVSGLEGCDEIMECPTDNGRLVMNGWSTRSAERNTVLLHAGRANVITEVCSATGCNG